MVHLVKAMVFAVVTYGCESWTIKKADRNPPLQLPPSKASKESGGLCPRAKNSSLISKVLFPSGPVRSIRQMIVISQAHRDLESSPVDLTVKNLPIMQETRVQYLVGKIPWRKKW